jgi:hypothetical protein
LAAEPAAVGLGDPPSARRAGRGGAPLVHQPHDDPGLLGLVAQRLHKVGAAPLPQPPVLHPARILLGNAVGVAHDEGPDLMLDGEGDDLLGGLMVGVVDAAAMASFGTPQAGSVAAPATRPALPRRGRPPGGLGLAVLLIGTVQVALGADGSP